MPFNGWMFKGFLREVRKQDAWYEKQRSFKRPTCELMCPAACMSATSAELLTALREWMRGLRARGVGPLSSRGVRCAWCSRG